MPRLFDANASPNTGIFIGDDNFYNPRIANQNLLISSLKNTSVLRKLHQARLAARGINLPADNEKCSFKDDKDSTKWERIRMKMGFYDNISKDTKDRIAAGTSTCNDILDSLSYPTDLFPNEIEKCSKNTLLCTTTSTVPTMKKPFNPILKVVTPILFAEKKIDQGKFGELKETFTINEFLNTLVDPYYDQLDFNDKDGVSIIYKQTDLNGNFRK
ncbi:MAG: hypothetical protein K0R94_410 [Burkholderiales bacterium]|jgi:hypothetical protein|nr:hypothetical protein [Burkholderiales bacterium]